MTQQSQLDLPALYPYLLEVSLRDDPLLAKMRAENLSSAHPNFQIAPEQGQFMALLVKIIGAINVLEIGTYTGYSALCMARALPENGQLVTCDLNEDHTQIATSYWKQAEIFSKIDLRLGPADKTLNELVSHKLANAFDMAFIDADKTNYDLYFERCLELVRPNGLIVFDNMLWGGRVIDQQCNDPDTMAIRALNEKLLRDDRVDITLLPLADGVTIARKR